MSDNRPNILLITTDQQRGDCLGIEGHPVLQTPNLDWLGASGVRFNRAYSACPVCIPARRTIITGRKPHRHGLVQNGQAPLPYATIASSLTAAGYQTHMVGKGHFCVPPTEAGFQTAQWADSPRSDVPGKATDYQRFLHRNGLTSPRISEAHGIHSNGYTVRDYHLEERFHFSNWCADEAVNFLDHRDESRPFFMMVNFLHPHQPLTPPRFYFERYMRRNIPEPYVADWARVFDAPVRGLQPECWRLCLDPDVMKEMRAAYYGSINHIDDQIARFVNGRRLPKNTIVVFASDHGEMLGDHQWLRKRNPYEPSARVPLLMQFPSTMNVQQQRVLSQPVELMDIMPTLLDAVGVDVPQGVDGRSLMPLLRGESDEWREYLHGECSDVPTSGGGMQYLTDGRRKYIWLPGRGEEQFFDLESDPKEMLNLAAVPSYAGEIARWRAILIRELTGRPEGFTDGTRLLKLNGATPARVPVAEG